MPYRSSKLTQVTTSCCHMYVFAGQIVQARSRHVPYRYYKLA